MYTILIWSATVAALSFVNTVHAKAVFAHYLVGTITENHAHQDIDDAIAVGLDGFALNIFDPTQPFVTDALGYLFGYAATTNFKLFVSMDLSASRNACNAGGSSCNGPNDYNAILTNYLGSTAYYRGPNGFPMVSTFTSGGATVDVFNAWKQTFANQIYFIPDFDDTQGYYDAADGWWSYWGNLVDGLFSWEASWPPYESSPGDVSPDQPVLDGAKTRGKGYMIGLSALQYKDAYGVNEYRAGSLNLPTRMRNILTLSPQPDFVEIITWNDGPESHYIGDLWPEENSDSAAAKYSGPNANPHQAWQPLVTSFIAAFKNDGTASSMTPPGDTPVGAMWYKTILQSATCPENKPSGFDTGTDALNWAVVLPAGSSGMQIRATSNGNVLATVSGTPGLNMGAPDGVQAGEQRLEVLDAGGNVVLVATNGRCVSSGCPDGIYDFNYQVVGLKGAGAATGCFT